jgi:hypothetical protein
MGRPQRPVRNILPWTSARLTLACLVLTLLPALGQGQGNAAQPVEAIGGILAAFDHHPIVAIGENHAIKQAGDFYLALVKSPQFAAKVNDVVIEFASQTSQTVLDRYIAGDEVPLSELSQAWRNTTKTLSWESPIYPALLAAIREVNGRLPRQRRLRVVAGDALIDWGKVHTHDDWASFQPNDVAFAQVIDRQVLARGRKALVILGGNHLTKGGDRDRGPNTTTRVTDKTADAMFVVLLHTGAAKDAQDRMAAWQPPMLAAVPGTWLASLPRGSRALGDVCDALLYLGPGSSLTTAQPDWDKLDADYLKEVDRRHRIQFGCPLDLNRWKRGQRPCP